MATTTTEHPGRTFQPHDRRRAEEAIEAIEPIEPRSRKGRARGLARSLIGRAAPIMAPALVFTAVALVVRHRREQRSRLEWAKHRLSSLRD